MCGLRGGGFLFLLLSGGVQFRHLLFEFVEPDCTSPEFGMDLIFFLAAGANLRPRRVPVLTITSHE